MRRLYGTTLGRVLLNKKRGRIAAAIALALCIGAVPLVTLMSSRPAMTESKLICGIEEYLHMRKCFESVLTCEKPESEGYAHGEGCYDEGGDLICEIEESEGHSHDDDCYACIALICELPEIEGHAHDEDCYDEDGDLLCDIEEIEGHTHNRDCYSDIILVCELPEIKLHSHDEDCYGEDDHLICEMEELVEHIHDDDCYSSTVICEKEEHRHTEDCFDTLEAFEAFEMAEKLKAFEAAQESEAPEGIAAATASACHCPPDCPTCGDCRDVGGRDAVAMLERGYTINPHWSSWDNYRQPGGALQIIRRDVTAITFVNLQKNYVPGGSAADEFKDDNDYTWDGKPIEKAWDATNFTNGNHNQDTHAVIAWVTGSQNDYHLYFGGEGGVLLPPDSRWMFSNMENLRSIDLRNVNTSKAMLMSWMFSNTELTELDLSSFNTEIVLEMSYMFANSFSLDRVNLSSFNTSNVTNMAGMLSHCGISQTFDKDGDHGKIDLRHFNTAKVTNFSSMFQCIISGTLENATEIDMSWSSSAAATNVNSMFNLLLYDPPSNNLQHIRINSMNLTGVSAANRSGFADDATISNVIWYVGSTAMQAWLNTNFSIPTSRIVVEPLTGSQPQPADWRGTGGDCQCDRPAITGRINGEKIITGSGFAEDPMFTFKVEEVDEDGIPVDPPWQMTVERGVGEFHIDIPISGTGRHYFRISEVPGPRNGWNYDPNSHIVWIEVTGIPGNYTVFTSQTNHLPGSSSVSFGTTTFTHAAPNPPMPWGVTPSTQFTLVGSGFTNFIICDGSRQFYGYCGNSSFSPPRTGDVFQDGPVRDHTAVALAAAVGNPIVGYHNSVLNGIQYANLFRVPQSTSITQAIIWSYENGRELSGSDAAIRNILDEMMEKYHETPTGHGISSLAMNFQTMTATIGRLSFAHVGYQPRSYDAWLSWTPQPGLLVRVNNIPRGSPWPVRKMDDITIEFTGSGTVDFTLTDNMLYLKGGSIRGVNLRNIANANGQPCLIGYAEFVTLRNTFRISRVGGGSTESVITFNNHFAPLLGGDVTIRGKKEIRGTGSTSHQFTFDLVELEGPSVNSPEKRPGHTDSVTITGADSFEFVIPQLDAGTYWFRVTERIPDPPIENWTYDREPQIVTVEVSDSGAITVVYPEGTVIFPEGSNGNYEHEGMVFVNHYKDQNNAEIKISGIKTVDISPIPPDIDARFSFSLVQVENANGDTYVPKSAGDRAYMDSVFRIGAGSFEFEIKDLKPGEYFYKIVEVAQLGNPFWVYDTSEYIVTVFVTDNTPNAHTAAVTAITRSTGPGQPFLPFNPNDPVAFENGFTFVETCVFEIEGNKRITGVDSTNAQFHFTLRRIIKNSEDEWEYALPLITYEASVTGAGTFKFPPVTGLPPGTHFFKIAENNTDPIEGWKYDESEYIIRVEAFESGSSTWEIYELNGEPYSGADEIIFTNRRVGGILPNTGSVWMRILTATAIVLSAALSVSLTGTLIYKQRRKRRLLDS